MEEVKRYGVSFDGELVEAWGKKSGAVVHAHDYDDALSRIAELEADYKALAAQLAVITADRDGIQPRLNERLRVGEEIYQELKRENERLRAALASRSDAEG